MPDSGTESKSKQTILLSRLSVILPVLAGVMADSIVMMADSIVIQNNYSYALDIDKIDCDYYAYLKNGKPEFYGEYMIQYSWAEETCGLLWERTDIL